jgi:hypothetical protein
MEFGGVFHLTQYAAEPLAPYAGLPTLGVQGLPCLFLGCKACLAGIYIQLRTLARQALNSIEPSQGKPCTPSLLKW